MSQLFEYPVFEADQVLTAKNLNDSIDYLTDQQLLTRRKLIGRGIACGLEISRPSDESIIITKGVGLTSMGYLIPLQDTTYHYYRKYEDQASNQYALFKVDANNQYPLWELMTHQEYAASEDSDIVKLSEGTDFNTSDMAVILYLEIIDQDLKSCIGEDCDEKGVSRRHTIRPLLINKGHLRRVIQNGKGLTGSDINTIKSSLRSYCDFDEIDIPRFQFNLPSAAGYNHKSIDNLDAFIQSYQNIINTTAVRTANAIHKTYDVFQEELQSEYDSDPFLNYEKVFAYNTFAMTLYTTLQSEPLTAQYLYDFLKDLKYAYEEFVETSCEYYASCCPDSTEFPLHIMLNEAIPFEDKSVYRHHFEPSLADPNQSSLLDRLKSLHKRMVLMIEQFEVPFYADAKDIKITPGKTFEWPLSAQTPGFYYDRNEALQQLLPSWNFLTTTKCQQDRILNYHAGRYFPSTNAVNPGSQPLLYNFDEKGFFRIEGHIGLERDVAFKYLKDQIHDFNLPFDIREVSLNPDGVEEFMEESDYRDIQVTYACNRAEYLACLASLSKALKKVIDIVDALKKNSEVDLNQTHKQGDTAAVQNGNDAFTYLELFYHETEMLKVRLPEDISDFDPETFQTSYLKVTSMCKISSILLQLLLHFGLPAKESPIISVFGLISILVRPLFDKMLDDCMDKKFMSLYKSYLERLKEYQLGKLFPELTKQLPGYEHLGGVNSGGTFILVYDELPEEIVEEEPVDEVEEEESDCFQTEQVKTMLKQSIYLTEEYENAPLDKILDYVIAANQNEESGGSAEAVEETEMGAKASAEKTEEQAGEQAEPEETKTITFDEALFGNYDQDKDYLAERKARILEEFGIERQETPKVQMKQRIIADFALPYRCCSLTVEQKVEPEVDIVIEKTKFCKNDKTKYPITGTPKGGTFVGDGLSKSDDEVPYFVPSSVTNETIQITYLYDQTEIKKTLYVYNPIASFRVIESMDLRGNVVFDLINTSQNEDRVQWFLNGKKITSIEGDLRLVPAELSEDELIVYLIAYREDVCQDTSPEKALKIPDEEIVISLKQATFCYHDNSSYPFTLSPSEGVFQPADISGIEEKDGVHYFIPSLAEEDNIVFRYTVGEKSETFTIAINRPVAGFEVDNMSEEGVTLVNKSKGHQNIIWYVDGSSVGTDDTLFIEYEKYQDHKQVMVSLVAGVGECTDTYPESPFLVDIPSVEEEVVFELEKPDGSKLHEYCNDDDHNYAFTTTPVGDSLGGDSDGVMLDAVSGYVFSPYGLGEGTRNFEYKGKTISVRVNDATVPPINFELSDWNEKTGEAAFRFYHPAAQAASVTWNFPDLAAMTTDPSSEPFTYPFSLAKNPDGVFEVDLMIGLHEGCQVTTKLTVDVRQYIDDDDNNEVVVVNLDGVQAIGYTTDELFTDSKVYVFAQSNDTTLNDIRLQQDQFKTQITNPTWISQLNKGDITRVQTGPYNAWLSKVQAMMLVNQSDKQATTFLTRVYTYVASSFLALVENQSVDITKTGMVASTMGQMKTQLTALAKAGIDVKSSGEWQRLDAYYANAFKSKPLALSALEKI